jgi:cytolysin-activating lysine-acyltransferase
MTLPLTDQQREELAAYAKGQAQKVMAKIPILGAVAWLMMQQSTTRHTLLSELEWRVMPALVLDQAKLYMREEAPVAYVSWARLSEVAAKRYQQAPHHLANSDWQSGDQNWLIDLCTPFGGASDIITELRSTVFKSQPLHQFSLNETGQLSTVTWPALGDW